MNRKLVYGALVLGMLSLTGCVDDTESQSVTAVRQAKAEQLKALGEASKIQAEADKIQAEGYAAYQQALAEYQRAQAALQNVRTEKEKAEAEVAIKRAQAEIERLGLENEQKLLELKRQIQVAQNNLQSAIDQAAQNKRTQLNLLFQEYRTASTNLYNDQSNLAYKYQDLRWLEAGLISFQEARESQIKSLNKQIEGYEEDIAEAEENLAAIEKYQNDAEGAKAALEAAQEALVGLKKTKDLAVYDQNKESYFQTQAQNDFNGSVYMANVNDLKSYNWSNIISWSSSDEYGNPIYGQTGFRVYVNEIPHRVNQVLTGADEGKYGLFLEDVETGKESYVVLFDGENSETVTLNKDAGEENSIVTYTEYTKPYALAENGAANLTKFLGNITAEAEKNLADAQKAYKDAVAAEAKAKTAYDNAKADQKAKDDAQKAAVKAVADAQKAFDDAKTDVEKAEANLTLTKAKAEKDLADAKLAEANKALSDANDVYNNGYMDKKGNWVPSAKDQTATALNNEVNAENALDQLTPKTEKILGYYNALAPQAETFDGYVAALNAANLAYAKTELASNVADKAYNLKAAEVNGLNIVLAANNNLTIDGQTINILDKIKEYKDNIKTYQDNIENCKEQIAEWEKIGADEADQEKAVEEMKQSIAELENKIEQDKVALEIAYANLEAALKAQGSEE